MATAWISPEAQALLMIVGTIVGIVAIAFGLAVLAWDSHVRRRED